MAHLHGQDILHRDVSPANIFFDQRHNAHLGDFDSAIAIDDQSKPRPITTNSFAAPEELEGGPLDVRSDLYSVGALLYVVATGMPRPLDVSLLRELRSDLPASFAELVGSLLSELPTDRPSSVETVIERLGVIRHSSNLDALIAAGESATLEFKSSVRWGVPEGGVIKELEKVIVKTVAGFLNSGDGGTLLIGIADDGSIIGLEGDYGSSPNIGDRDGFELHLRKLLSKSIGESVHAFVTVAFHHIDDKDVCQVHIDSSDHPVYVQDEGNPVFFLRTGNATNALPVDEVVKYYATRWG